MRNEFAFYSKAVLVSALLLCTLLSTAQRAKLVKGIVVNGNDERVASCKVMVKGTETAVTANACGEFGIETDKNLFTLVFSSPAPSGGAFEVPFSEHDLKRNDSIVFRLVNLRTSANNKCNKPVNTRLRQVRVR